MALDGIFLRHIKKELSTILINARVDKVYQPSKEEIVLSFRTIKSSYKLLLSAGANSPRIHITNCNLENPKMPPMFCMLLRKKLLSARLLNIRQENLERVLYLDFEATNEFKDKVKLTIAIEIMGKHSNIILIDSNCVIVEAIKRVTSEMSSKRMVLPGIKYKLPPAQDKICILNSLLDESVLKIKNLPKNIIIEKALLNTLQGISPIVCREISFKINKERSLALEDMTASNWQDFSYQLKSLVNTAKNISGIPYLITDETSKPVDFSFNKTEQYGSLMNVVQYETFSKLLDDFYREKDSFERMKSKHYNVLKLITNIIERLNKKINLQKSELNSCEKRDEFKIAADLINANLYKLQKGQNFANLENFYEEGYPLKIIELNPCLTPAQNAQKYYKKYNKLKTAEYMLNSQIEKAVEEKNYVESILDSLLRANCENEVEEIKKELKEQGYLREKKAKKHNEKALPPLKFISSDGFTILVGRNNKQNDDLTLKKATKSDIWFHVKDIHGSHAILVLNGKKVSDTAIKEAALIAAFHSKAKYASSVAVDYTYVKYVHKPQGSKPGKVIYTNQKTIFVTPEINYIKGLQANK